MDTATLAPRRLGNLLIDKGYLTPDDLQSALEQQKQEGRKKLLGELLVEAEYCTEDQVVECLAAEYGVPYAKLDARLFDQKIVDILPREYVEKNLVLPLFLVRGVLTIAVSEPSNLFLIDEIHGLTNLQVQIVAASTKDIRRMITTLPNSKVFVIDDIIEDSDNADVTLIEEAIEDIGDVAEIAGQSPVIRLVNYIIFNAVKEGASDIHIEPAERCMRVRYRIDGRLHKSLEVPQHLLNAVTSRIKIMASMDISERRLPQDGRVHVMLEGRKIDLRVSTFPATHGEKTVIRVLDTRAVSLNLEDLGFAEDVLSVFHQNISAPNGIVLVTGPTGSGKSTTLYAALNAISSMENNVCTVEDPIEYHLPLINQFQVQTKIGMTFPKALQDAVAAGPGRDHGGRGPRRGDGAHRDPGRADRPPGLQHAAHQRRLLGHHPADQHGRRAVPDRRRAEHGAGAAAGAPHLREMPGHVRAGPHHPQGVGTHGPRIAGVLQGRGLQSLSQHGLQGAIAASTSCWSLATRCATPSWPIPPSATCGRLPLRDKMITLGFDGFRKVREGMTTVEEILHIVGDVAVTGGGE